MKTLQRFLAVFLASALTMVSPGLLPYQAAAQTKAPAAQAPLLAPSLHGASVLSPAASLGAAPSLQVPASLSVGSFSQAPLPVVGERVPEGRVRGLQPAASSAKIAVAAPVAKALKPLASVGSLGVSEAKGAGDKVMDAVTGQRSIEDSGAEPEAAESIWISRPAMASGAVALRRPRASSGGLAAGAILNAREPRTSFPLGGMNFSSIVKGAATVAVAAAGTLLALHLYAGGLPAVQKIGVFLGAYALVVLPSLIWHERGHAAKAVQLGDDTPRLEGRLSLDPRAHVDPKWTIGIPLFLMLLGLPGLGMARPVHFNAANFASVQQAYAKGDQEVQRARVIGSAKVALAGPLANLQFALAGALAYRLLGLYANPVSLAAMMLEQVTVLNLMLGFFNLLPIPGLDGGHLARLNPVLRLRIDRATAWLKQDSNNRFLGFMLLYIAAGPLMGLVMAAVNPLANLLLAGPVVGLGVVGLAVVGLAMLGTIEDISGGASGSSKYVLELPASLVKLTKDLHVLDAKANAPQAAGASGKADGIREALEAQLSGSVRQDDSGKNESLLDLLRRHGAEPVATYKTVNLATIRVEPAAAAALKIELETLGIRVWDDYRIDLPKPEEPAKPAPNQPLRKPVSLKEMISLIKADTVQAIVRQKYGPPDVEDLGPVSRFLLKAFMRLTGTRKPPVVPMVIIDSSADRTHEPLKSGISQVIDATGSNDQDDIGHGTHTSSTILAIDPWQKRLTMVKAFVGGGSTADIILRALTLSTDKGLASSNSWGNGRGDPEGPEAKKAKQNAETGQLGIFAAGNAGPYENTIGSPAIVEVKDDQGVHGIIAVFAADRSWRTARFSSRGPRGRGAKADYPNVGDHGVTAIGVDLEAQWPEHLGNHDRVDEKLGPVKAISGTSMATPNVAGATSLLAEAFEITDPARMHLISKALLESAAPTGRPIEENGRGKLDVDAAYKALEKNGFAAFSSERSRRFHRVKGVILDILERSGRKEAELRARWHAAAPQIAAKAKPYLEAALIAGLLFAVAAGFYAMYHAFAEVLQHAADAGPEIISRAAGGALMIGAVHETRGRGWGRAHNRPGRPAKEELRRAYRDEYRARLHDKYNSLTSDAFLGSMFLAIGIVGLIYLLAQGAPQHVPGVISSLIGGAALIGAVHDVASADRSSIQDLGELRAPGAALGGKKFELRPGQSLTFAVNEDPNEGLSEFGRFVANPAGSLIVRREVQWDSPKLNDGKAKVRYWLRLALGSPAVVPVSTTGRFTMRSNPDWAFSFELAVAP